METLVDLVREGARRFDRKPALVIRPSFRTRTWRYRDLGAGVPRAARVLADAGVEPGDRVVIWSVNRPEWGLGFLAIAHAGAVAVPLDVRHTTDFAAKIAAQTSPKLVLASRQTAASAATLGLPIIWVESLPDLARRAEPLPTPPVAKTDLAEIVFTSGTTGEPKGAMITHGSLMACVTSMMGVFPIGPSERLLSVLPLSHLYEQVIGFLCPLYGGAAVVYPVSRQPAVLLRSFRDFKITTLLLVPQGLRLLEGAIERRAAQKGQAKLLERLHRIARPLPKPLRRLLFAPVLSQLGGKLKTIGVGASALEPELAKSWMDMGIDVLQGYGATEMSPVVTFTRPERNILGTVGEAIPGVTVRIADDGEILATGPNIFAGYWQNPEATAAAIDADGWYHTGDLGQLSPDGMLTFRGRKKDMLALPDGQKVYPDDVEQVLIKDGRLKDATVVGWPAGLDLKVHAVLLMDDPALAEDVIKTANRELAPHQQIRGWTVWPDEDLPRTHTLKVRKYEVIARLPALEAAEDAAAAAPVSTAQPIAVVGPTAEDVHPVIGIIASLTNMGVGDIAQDARLSSDLNLDSLQRVELLGIIEEEIGTYVDDDALEPDATVAQVIAIVEAARDTKGRKGIFGWPLHPAVRLVGLGLQAVFVKPLVWLSYRVKPTGLEHLEKLDGPVLFTPNHCLHLDNAIILAQFPLAVRWRLSFAAAADTIYDNPFQGFLASVIANAFPLQREGGVRHSLEMLGARLDRGFNIILYPEGKLTLGGPLQPFRSGAGLIAVEGATPVVPVKLKIRRMSILDRRRLPAALRGDVELVVGEPIWFDAGTDAAGATSRLEAAVAAL
jgi:long-chain acyl-CoA synthetase